MISGNYLVFPWITTNSSLMSMLRYELLEFRFHKYAPPDSQFCHTRDQHTWYFEFNLGILGKPKNSTLAHSNSGILGKFSNRRTAIWIRFVVSSAQLSIYFISRTCIWVFFSDAGNWRELRKRPRVLGHKREQPETPKNTATPSEHLLKTCWQRKQVGSSQFHCLAFLSSSYYI